MPDLLNAPHEKLRERASALATELSSIAGQDLAGPELSAEVRSISQAHGIFAMTQPVAYGGTAASTLELTIVRDELAAHDVARLGGIFGPGPGLLAQANQQLQDQFLGPVLAGELQGSFGFTEPDDAERHTWATVDGEDLIVNGQKSYVTGGADAGFINTLVEVDGSGPAMVLIETSRQGVELIRRFNSLDGSHHAGFRFTNVRVPAHHVLGAPGKGLNRAMDQVTSVRMMIAANAVGSCRFVLGYVGDYLQRPHRSGSTLGAGERTRLRYGELRIQTYAARSMLYRTARLIDAGENAVNEAMATKAFATETVGRVVDEGIQLVGGQALTDAHPLSRLLREVRAVRLAEGPTDTLAINISRGHLDLGKGRL